ncbi:hypothetical protein OS128_00050 [Corynebacterium sp. P5848]|uniref:hypothetical protein n=1 Tax=Corynebacterium marambiense TaxID=2765364 RepID=UPI002260C531|nr:hypothetical protein [Corynebacterium marambiense]MCX7541310.1 hypothetical protein [Corynebacterium marambiense]
MEHWHLDHPEIGRIELTLGSPGELRELDPGWPLNKEDVEAVKESGGSVDKRTKKEADWAESAIFGATTMSSFLKGAAGTAGKTPLLKTRSDRIDAAASRARDAVTTGVLITVDGAIRGRLPVAQTITVRIDKRIPSGTYSRAVKNKSAPCLKIDRNALHEIRSVLFRKGGEIIEFTPPPGSHAEDRYRQMEETPWKRLLYPLGAGLGKAGWAIIALVLVPLIGRIIGTIIDWIIERLPDVDIPWPDINLPSIPWPTIRFPAIPWPDINLPKIPWPDYEIPEWLEWLLDHPRVWLPIVIGLIVGIVSLRNGRKSRKIRQQWKQTGTGRPPGTEAGESNERRDDLDEGETPEPPSDPNDPDER